MLFSLLKHHFDLNITDTALKVSRSLYCFTTSISHGVENYFPRLWDTGISDAILSKYVMPFISWSIIKRLTESESVLPKRGIEVHFRARLQRL